MAGSLKSISEMAVKLSKELLAKPKSDLGNISPRGGAYLIKREGRIIYVGKGRNLARRIRSDHISGERGYTTSELRRKITKKFGIPAGRELRDWMGKCDYVTLEIEDPDLRTLVEGLTISFLRKRREPLLNES